MKNIKIIILLFLCISCNKRQELTSSKISNLDSLQTIVGKVSTDDTLCLKQISLAKEKIKQNQLTYYLPMSSISYGRELDELRKLLKPYSIQSEIFFTYCTGHGKGKSCCYQEYMNEIINKKFKKGFIDSLAIVADKNYLKKNSDKIFDGMDVYDQTLFYPKAKTYESQRDDCETDFIRTYLFPNKFNFSFNDENKKFYWAADLDFVLYTNGKTKTNSINIEFGNEKNNIFKTLVENQIKSFIEKTKWNPRQQNGIKVNGKLLMRIVINKQNRV